MRVRWNAFAGVVLLSASWLMMAAPSAGAVASRAVLVVDDDRAQCSALPTRRSSPGSTRRSPVTRSECAAAPTPAISQSTRP